MRYKGGTKIKGGVGDGKKFVHVIRGVGQFHMRGYLKAESLYVDRLGSEQQLPLEKMFLA